VRDIKDVALLAISHDDWEVKIWERDTALAEVIAVVGTVFHRPKATAATRPSWWGEVYSDTAACGIRLDDAVLLPTKLASKLVPFCRSCERREG
jgi:hypothetical protein